MGFAQGLIWATLILAEQIQATTVVQVPTQRPQDAVLVPADFVGFGFASPNLPDYVGSFSENLINSVANRMTATPIIRIGGTSGDTLEVNPDQKEAVTCHGAGCPYGSNGHYVVGPDYFDAFKSFANTRMTFQVPMLQPLNESNALAYAKYAYAVLGKSRTAAIALGNEVGTAPDDYKTPGDYITAAKELEQGIIAELSLSGSAQQIFEVLDLSNSQVLSSKPWTLSDAFEAGLNSNNLVQLAAEHYYQVTGASISKDLAAEIQSRLMNHSAIVQHFVPYLAALNYLNGKVPYVLSETGSALVGNLTFNNGLGSGLWAVDFQLYSMSNGVSRVDGSQRPTVDHALWEPTSGSSSSPGPSVRANYYAQPFIADFIYSSSQATSVVEIPLGSDYMTAYAAYDGQTLSRVALVNFHFWDATQGSSRPNQTFTLSGLPSSLSSVVVATLTSPYGATALGYDLGGSSQNITYGGEQWSYKVDNGMGHQTAASGNYTIPVSGGEATIIVEDSSAVLVLV